MGIEVVFLISLAVVAFALGVLHLTVGFRGWAKGLGPYREEDLPVTAAIKRDADAVDAILWKRYDDRAIWKAWVRPTFDQMQAEDEVLTKLLDAAGLMRKP